MQLFETKLVHLRMIKRWIKQSSISFNPNARYVSQYFKIENMERNLSGTKILLLIKLIVSPFFSPSQLIGNLYNEWHFEFIKTYKKQPKHVVNF